MPHLLIPAYVALAHQCNMHAIIERKCYIYLVIIPYFYPQQGPKLCYPPPPFILTTTLSREAKKKERLSQGH